MPGTQADEARLHITMSAYRIGGEWFRYDGAVRFVIRDAERKMRNQVDQMMRYLCEHFEDVKAEAEARTANGQPAK
jgi:hypothetical protein